MRPVRRDRQRDVRKELLVRSRVRTLGATKPFAVAVVTIRECRRIVSDQEVALLARPYTSSAKVRSQDLSGPHAVIRKKSIGSFEPRAIEGPRKAQPRISPQADHECVQPSIQTVVAEI